MLTIDIISDVMCPWCYIGKRRLEKALSQFDDKEISITWHPYLLDPTIPPEGMDRKAYLDRKFGPSQAKSVYAAIKEAGSQEGIPFAFEKITRSPSTINAHRLIYWSEAQFLQDDIVTALFDAYFINGQDIGDTETLVSIAEKNGMDGEIVGRLLGGDADLDVVKNEIEVAQKMGISGVPCFVFGKKYVVMGAQDPEILVSAINTALSDTDLTETDANSDTH